MPLSFTNSLLAVACLVATGNAFADCAADHTVQDTQRFYSEAQKLEQGGNASAALAKYVVAQSYTCETNPVEMDAARRAVALALPLGAAAEKQGNLQGAFDLYESGGHYAAADRMLMLLVRSRPDDPATFTKAREVLEYRALAAFASNHHTLLGLTGAYRPDPKNLAEVMAMPAVGAQRALQKEAALFNEQYLRDSVQLAQSRPDDPTDTGEMQRAMSAQQAFIQKYPNDPLQASRDTLNLVHSWSAATADQLLSHRLMQQLGERREQRASLLIQKYSGSPALLEAAMDYYTDQGSEQRVAEALMPVVKAQAMKLGDAAMAGKRYGLAAAYYDVADADAKAAAARNEQQRLAMTKMQPSIDRMKQQAEALQQQFSDPAKVQAMREQALAAQARFKQQQQTNAKTNAKQADELAKQLGM